MTRPAAPRALLPVLLILAASLAACSREVDDWRAAQAADTVAAYEQFVHEHPASAHATEAASRAAQLAESEDWRRAQEQDTLQAYQYFLEQHPASGRSAEARMRIDTITLGSQVQQDAAAAPVPAAPPVAPAADPPAPAVTAPPSAPPAAPAPRASPSPAAASRPAPGWGAQLGAFSSSAAADAQWQTLSSRQLAPLRGREHRIVGGTGGNGSKVYRLQVVARGEADARGLCSALTAAGQSCVVVHP